MDGPVPVLNGAERPLYAKKVEERRDQGRVGWRHRIGAQILWPRPFQRLVFARGDKTGPTPAYIERHKKVEVWVGKPREGERREASLFYRDPEFFAQFPDQGRFRPLVQFHLAAGKLPQARKRLVLRT